MIDTSIFFFPFIIDLRDEKYFILVCGQMGGLVRFGLDNRG
jgi:hypothetical protein